MSKESKKNFNFYVGECSFCNNKFTKVRQFNGGNWVCEKCFDELSMKSAQEYENVIIALWEEGITADRIADKLEAILLAFRYSHNLMSRRERNLFEQEIKQWKNEKKDGTNDGKK